MAAEPFECEHFGEMQMAAAQGRAALEQPVPPLVYGLKGFLAVIEDVEGLDIINQQPPTSITMQFLLATDNAPGLVALGAMFSPELATLDLQPDGKPVRFEPPQMPVGVRSAHLAMTDTALALSVGDNSETALSGLLSAASSEPPPVFSMHMDASRYYAFVGDAAMLPQDGDDEMPAEARAAARQAMLALGDLIDRVSVTVNLTPRGIEMPSVVTLTGE
ncbi:MAG: hypothetical protein U5K76_05955 [Woeseiaceae bacterium]|nr:hypothetical protein [Woeseiaceae bacterium]